MAIRHIHRFILIALILFTTEEVTHAEMTASQIAMKYSPSVVTIVALDENDQPLSLGSGFFINTKGDIVTNHHVLQGSAKAIIKTTKGEKGNILEIIKDDPDLDLLVAKTSFNNTTSLTLGDSETLTVGEDIVAIGNPAGLEGTVSKGIISAIRKVDSFTFIQISAPISPGSSGGPVFNMAGKVIGIATAYLDAGQNLNFAMPVDYLKTLKGSKVRLGSLPKAITKSKNAKNYSSVEIFNRKDNYLGDGVWSEFDLRNLNNYPIKNIKLFFIYTDYRGNIVTYSLKTIEETILAKLALQFSHGHKVRNYLGYMDDRGRYYDDRSEPLSFFYESDDTKPGGVSLRKGFKVITGSVEIRILDFEIDRTTTSPSDLLFK